MPQSDYFLFRFMDLGKKEIIYLVLLCLGLLHGVALLQTKFTTKVQGLKERCRDANGRE